jgi:hypothetical protein
MKTFTLDQQKHIENCANNTLGLKDYSKSGLSENLQPKEGFYQLKDNRVVKLGDLKGYIAPAGEKTPNYTELAKDFPELHNCKGIGMDKKTNTARSGYALLEDGKVISLKKLNEAIRLKKTNDIQVNE